MVSNSQPCRRLSQVGWSLVLAAAAVAPAVPAPAQEEGTARYAAPALMKRGLYQDAVRVLLADVAKKPEEQCGQEFLMLGECYYLMGKHAEARPYLAKAQKLLPAGRYRKISEYRLACVSYRLGDRGGAMEQIQAYVAKYPQDARSGTLLLFKMRLLAAQGKAAEGQIEAAHKHISDYSKLFGPAVMMAADKLLTDFYVKHGQEEKARSRLVNVVLGFRKVINEYTKDQRPIPAGLEEAHDRAAMQLGAMAIDARQFPEAVKWLENVRFDPELQAKAALMLAQVAYSRQDFDRAASYLLRPGLMDLVGPGKIKSDMYLLLGLSEKNKKNPNPFKMEEYLRRVGPDSDGYCQAQLALGDLEAARKQIDQAIKAYTNAKVSPRYEAHALFSLGHLYVAKAEKETDREKQDPFYQKASEFLSQLGTKYPTSALLKEASKAIDDLAGKGYRVSLAMTDEQKAAEWMRLVAASPGTPEAARALISLARVHHRAVVDKASGKYVKPPNYVACTAAGDKLLDSKAYDGKGFDAASWRNMLAEARYFRGRSHLASHQPPAGNPGDMVQPTYLARPDLELAIQDFRQAKTLVDPKRLDLVRDIELSLLEAMLKSDSLTHRKEAEARFKEMAAEYGNDVRFQKLSMDLAEWYREQGRSGEAAALYKDLAERAQQLSRDEVLRVLYLAGQLYSKAAGDTRSDPGKLKHGILISQKPVVKLAGLLRTHRPFGKFIRLDWPAKARDISGSEALQLVSEASGIPFVWRPTRGRDTVAEYLHRKRVRFTSLQGTARQFLEQVLDLSVHELAYDVGVTSGKPTLRVKPFDPEEPEAYQDVRTIEIYDARRWAQRYEPLARNYGAWRQVHGSSGMLFNVVQQIEKVSGTKVLWAEGVRKEDALAAEFKQVPGVSENQNGSCAVTLAKLLDKLDLKYDVVPRNRSTELYEQAKECFNQIRQIDPKSRYGEKSLFLLALNFFRQDDYDRMKIVLKEYLRVFDSPSHEHHYDACFWVGWVFEHERRFQDACRWYNRAAEEQLVICKPAADDKMPTRQELKEALSYDTAFALEERVTGSFRDVMLADQFLEFFKLNANVSVRLDPSATGIDAPINRELFQNVTVFGLLCDVLEQMGLTFRVENIKPRVAEKAYYRMGVAYKKDNLMPQALASCRVLLRRFPETSRRRDAYKLMLDVYKGLKDYRNVLAMLEILRKEMGDDLEAYKIDFEIGWVYFDLCRYAESAEHFRRALARAKDPMERVKIRDGFARALFRAGKAEEALAQFQELLKTEAEPLRVFVDRMMIWYLEQAAMKTVEPALPAEAAKLMQWYTGLTEAERGRLDKGMIAQVTWVYYVQALADLRYGKEAQAVEKLRAAGNSTDDWMAADAIYRLGLIHIRNREYKKAKETFEYLLFTTKTAEVEVKATYALGLCLAQLGQPEEGEKRFDQLLERYPDSPYAEQVAAKRRAATQPATGAGTAPAMAEP